MTDRHAGFIVVLENDIREDDAQATIKAIMQIKGVLNVAPIVADPMLEIAKTRAKIQIAEGIHKLLMED